MRTALVFVSCVVVFAGCLSGPAAPGTTPAESPTDAPGGESPGNTPGGETPTDAPDDGTTRTSGGGTATPACEEAPVETVDPARESVTPSPLPERPETLTSSSVEEFVVAYERAYQRNAGLTEDTTVYEVSVRKSDVRDVESGYVVTVTALYWYNEADPSHGTATPTVVHADGPEYTASYYVTDDRVRRDTDIDDDTLSPRRGRVVECWSNGG